LTAGDGMGGVLDMTVGPDGSVWAGTQYPGLLHWTGRAWQAIADPDGITGGRINDIQVDASGTLWCATAGGLAFYGGGAWRGLDGGEASAIEFGPGGAAYLLAGDGSIWRYAAGLWTALPPAQEGKYQTSHALHVARDGAVWLGTQNGAFRYDGQAWRQFTAQDGLPSNEVVAIAEGADGWLWFGTGSGAARVDPATLKLAAVTWPALPTPAPTAHITPTPTPVAQIAPTPAPCGQLSAEPFATVYRDSQIAARLGCPTAEAATTPAAFQPFELGLMFWRANERRIDVLQADGTWQRFIDTWDESQPAYDPSLTPPEGLLQPVRGFGKVWREQLGGPQAPIGWALAAEQSYDMRVQPFALGQMITGPGGQVYVLYADGTWARKEKP
jgi:Two component regulator propeller